MRMNKLRYLLAIVALVATHLSAQSATTTVAWDPSPTAGIAGYRTYKSSGTNTAFTLVAVVAPTVTTYTYTGLPNGTTNRFYVTSFVNDPVTGVVESQPSNIATSYAPLAAPAPPGNLRATAFTASAIQLQWDNNGTYDAILVQRQKGAAGLFEDLPAAAGTTSAYLDGSLKANSLYGYRIAAKVGTVITPWSAEDFERTLKR